MIIAMEVMIILLGGLAITLKYTPFNFDNSVLFLAGAAAVLILAHSFLFFFRWQLLPSQLVIALLLIWALYGGDAGKLMGVLCSLTGLVFLSLSLALVIGFPVKKLPAPGGLQAVSAFTMETAYADDQKIRRRLQLKVWYPASKPEQGEVKRETLWSEFNNPDHFSSIERFFAAYLKNIKTHTLHSAPIIKEPAALPVIVYNHALLSIAADNTFMMEDLASHGYIVVSVRHKDQREEYQNLQSSLSPDEIRQEREEFLKLGEKLSPQERSDLSLKLYRKNKTLSEIVRRRSRDSVHVLDNLSSLMKNIPGCQDSMCADLERLGFIGFSLGGAVATELCKNDQRCKLVINQDGGVFGTDIETPVSVPYLMLYSEQNNGGNGFLEKASGETFRQHVFKGASHFDFHDAAIVLPILRWLGLLRSVNGSEFHKNKNAVIRDFLKNNL